MSERSLADKVVVVTGASSGFGKGAALEFAGAGASVVLAARRHELLEELVRGCEAGGGQALAVETDVSRRGDVAKLADAALTAFGRIDVWVNNAGVGAVGRFEEVPLEDHVQVIETDLLGTVYGSYAALRQFRDQKAGTLINVASVLGKMPAPYYASYVAAKHAVVGLSASLRQELAEDGMEDIHVCTVLPSSMDTPFFQHAANYSGHQVEPLPPTYDPEKVVKTILRLVTDPEDEVVVGAAGKVMTGVHEMARRPTEAAIGKQTRKAQEKAPPAENTSGSLHEPVDEGTEVTGGWRK
jgi:short-subunit dehydrogenase